VGVVKSKLVTFGYGWLFSAACLWVAPLTYTLCLLVAQHSIFSKPLFFVVLKASLELLVQWG